MEVKYREHRKKSLGAPAVHTLEFARMLAIRLGCSDNDGEEIVDKFVELIAELASQGYSVAFKNFGSFVIKEKKARHGVNTRGEDCIVNGFKALKFKQSRTLYNIINSLDKEDE